MLEIPRPCLSQVLEHILQEDPYEACGLLAGAGGRVSLVYPVPNVAPAPATTFLMDGQTQVNAMLDIERRGLDLLAFYHSHPPGSRTDPSPTDLAEARYPDVLTLIVVPPLRGGSASIRAFSLAKGHAVEVPCAVDAE
jgi:proteasome lid subunit RPN8/RPN11